jgi:16S rRNA C967 or C1407 C5-methylase (RsmB/RsmF family)/NOL1/NOP2/fmu family ribosome biogenesis protein
LKPLPKQLLKDLQHVKGFDEAALVAAHQQAAITSIRLNPCKSANIFAHAERVPWCETGRYLQERPSFTLDPYFHAGTYYVQEASSMFLDYMMRSLLPERDNLRVLDLCAAPGGKSTLIASMLGENSLLISNEVIRTRASILEENMTRWGYANTWVTSNDPRDFSKLPGYFDVMVVDAPCSGSGLFRKDERALDEWSDANVQLCAQRQQRILADVWPALKEDGILIYATCSYSPQEDEEILDWMASDLDAETLRVIIPQEWGIVASHSERANFAGYRFSPDKVKGEGFFIAAVRKKTETDSIKPLKFKSAHDKKALSQAVHLLDGENYVCLKANDEYNVIHPGHEADIHILQKAVYLRKAGMLLGQPTAKEWLPAHDIALSIHRSPNIAHIDVTKEQALHFLKKEDISVPVTEKGWYIITYEGQSLGWVKSLGNRFNNYLPKHWRIRMDISDADWA